jgi:ribosome-associated translation inhibitor RaiA
LAKTRPDSGMAITYGSQKSTSIFPDRKISSRAIIQKASTAIDDVKEEIERQIRKSKRLYAHIIRRGGALAKRLLRFDD